MSASWKLWFIRFSGWPALLTAIAAVALFMIAASVALSKIGNLSVVRSLLIATVALLGLVVVLLGVMTYLSRL
jgi:hypothetical protein